MSESARCIYFREGPFEAGELQAALGSGLSLEVPDSAAMTCTIADTFDNQLWGARQGLLVAVAEHRFLLFDGAQVAVEGAFRSALPRLIGKLPANLRQRLQADPIRALLPGPELALRVRTLGVLDDQGKTVARLEQLSLLFKGGDHCQLTVRPVRGYVKSFARLRQALEHSGFQSVPAGADRLLQRLGYQPTEYRSKPGFRIKPDELAQHLARRLCFGLIRVARLNEEGTRRGLDSEFLHDYRVNLRKVRSIISLFKAVFPEPTTVALKNDLAELMRRTNRLRDLDVYLLDKAHYFELLPPHLHAGLEKVFKDFAREQGVEQRKVGRWLAGRTYQREIERLQQFFKSTDVLAAGNADVPALALACQSIWKRYRKVCKIARQIDELTPDEQVHELRIQCKKLRYLLEFFAPLFPKQALKGMIKALKGLQDNLGRFNDYSVQQVSLQAYLQDKVDRGELDLEVADAIGALRLVLNLKQQQERAQVMTSFARFHSPEVHQSFEQCFDLREAS